MSCDELQHMADQAFVLFEWRRITSQGRIMLLFSGHDVLGLPDEYLPGGRCGESILFEKVFSIVEQACIDSTGDTIVRVAVSSDLNGSRNKFLPHGRSKSAIERAGPAGCGKLRHPDHIHEKQVHRRVAVLQLLRQEIVVGRGRMRREFAHHRDVGMGFCKPGDGLVPHALMVWFPGDEAECDGLGLLPGLCSRH